MNNLEILSSMSSHVPFPLEICGTVYISRGTARTDIDNLNATAVKKKNRKNSLHWQYWPNETKE